MCDASSSNTCGEFETILASCLVHGRRKFVEVADSFPDEVSHVLKELRTVYKNDAESKARNMTPEERLLYHQEKSKPVMDGLKDWFDKQFDQKLVEPNSGLGKAIKYMQKHWLKLTLFLRVAGAPLDNNIVERSLKRVILHRKNSMFYKTLNGARVGDIFMSLIHTAELQGENPFNYLVELLRHPKQVKEMPDEWMPWNYRETLACLGQSP
jgi:hypothetical protein